VTLRGRLGTGLAVVVVGLLGSVTTLTQSAPDRSKAPALGAAPRLTIPPIQKRTLANGLPVWIVEQHEVPLVQVNLVIHAGSGDDPPDSFGLASFTAAMLDEGAGTRSALEIADEVEFLGAALGTTSSFDASAVRLNVPVRQLAPALAVMADVALRPTFPPAEAERLRQERLTALLQVRDDAASVAPLAFARVVFGSSHRYGTAAAGTSGTIKAMTVAQMRAFHAARYRPSNATMIVAGDVTADGVLPQIEAAFGGWPMSGPVPRTAVPAAPHLAMGQVTIVDMPSAAQSQIRIGDVGVPRSTPDYFPLVVLNTILGGSFTSRLNQNLREEHGYSYGASSRFDMRLSAGAFQAGAGVQTDKTTDALREFFKELKGIQVLVSDTELAKAKNYIAFGFPSEFETITDLAAHLEEMAIYRLPDRYFPDYVANVQAVTAAQVQKAAATYIHPDRLGIVIVGDRNAIEAGVRALNLAPVRTLGIDEVVP
jgi:predicted Zn-dependent peptidase